LCAACTAYSRYCLDIGTSEDWFALQISLIPCLLGYNVIAERLKKEQETNPPKGKNPYRTWIDNYTAEDYQAAVEKGCGKSGPGNVDCLM
jgi:hydroxymethylpyrimidine/phosphomethylpyrimidine kinase